MSNPCTYLDIRFRRLLITKDKAKRAPVSGKVIAYHIVIEFLMFC